MQSVAWIPLALSPVNMTFPNPMGDGSTPSSISIKERLLISIPDVNRYFTLLLSPLDFPKVTFPWRTYLCSSHMRAGDKLTQRSESISPSLSLCGEYYISKSYGRW